jgi:hypothetical protein
MGVQYLWKVLREEGLLEEWGGLALAREVENQTLAVDVSQWVVEAQTQPAYQQIENAHIKVRAGGGWAAGPWEM